MKRLAGIIPDVVAVVGLGAWLLVGFELTASYLKALGLAGAVIGDLGIAIVGVGDIPRTLALLLAMTAALWIGSERMVQGRPVLRRQLPLAFAICAAALIAAVLTVHFAFSGQAAGEKLLLFDGLTWPLLALTIAAVTGAGALVALLARSSRGRVWPVLFAGLPSLAAILFYGMVTRRIADYGVDTDTFDAFPLIFPRPLTLIAGLLLPIAAGAGLALAGRRSGIERPVATALIAVGPWLYAAHALVCLGTASPFALLCALIGDDGSNTANEWAIWILAVVFGAIWVALFAIQRRRYLSRRPER